MFGFVVLLTAVCKDWRQNELIIVFVILRILRVLGSLLRTHLIRGTVGRCFLSDVLEPVGHDAISGHLLLHASQGPSSRVHFTHVLFSIFSKLIILLKKLNIIQINNLEHFYRFTCCAQCSTQQLRPSQRCPRKKELSPTPPPTTTPRSTKPLPFSPFEPHIRKSD